jgi:hypothetical protein
VNIPLPFQSKFQAWTEWFGLALMSWAAPVVAFLICQFRFCFRMDYDISVSRFFYAISFCAIPAIPTFLALLPFRRRTLSRWMSWIVCTVGWTFILLYVGEHEL